MAVWSVIKTSDIATSKRTDADYFKPEYMDLSKKLTTIKAIFLRKDLEFVRCGPFGSTITCDTYIDNGVVVARPFNIDRMEFQYENIAFISHNDVIKKGLHLYSYGDIFFSRVGDIKVGFLSKNDDYPKVTISPNIIAARIKQNTIRSEYLVVFLNTHYGIKQIERGLKVVAQPTISTSLIQNLRVYIPTETIQDQISQIFQEAIYNKIKSQKNFAKAQQLLESELGLDKLSFGKPVGYTARFSEVIANSRTDADYYQLKYKQLDNIAAKFPVKKIRAISEKLETGSYSLSYSSEGRMYLRGVDINKGFINSDSILRTKHLAANLKNTVIKDDILVTRVGSIGVCAIIENTHAGSLYSDNLIRIRISDQVKEEINAQYLNLLLNTTYGQMQMVRYSRGSVQQRLNQSQLALIPVPIIKWENQLKIERLLKKHRKDITESKQLLDQAKTRVEQLIEEAVRR